MKSDIKESTYPVPAGTYIVSERKNSILTAYLGTCTGITLCDRKAKIGGIIHILLPEPNNGSAADNSGNYALTGLPVFIRELTEKGAAIKDLEATIAGGALVGELTEHDMDLDIGGRTVEISEKILSDAGIRVIKRESGGFFSCRLSLNLNTFESTISPVYDESGTDMEAFTKPTREQLEASLDNICSIPQVVLKIIRMIRDKDYSFEDVAKEVRQDQVITAKLLKLCNSAFLNGKAKVDSIDRILVMLGEKQLLQIVMSAAFGDFFSGNGRGYSLCKGGMFTHALGTALLCEQLAHMTGSVSPDLGYTAGLLHDIGKVVLDQFMNRAYPFFYRKMQMGNENLFLTERATFGITHDEAGEMLAEKWALPENITDSIKNHHNPGYSSEENMELTNIVYLSDLLMSRFVVGQELERLNINHLKYGLKKIGLGQMEFPSLIEKIPVQVLNLPFSAGIQNGFLQ